MASKILITPNAGSTTVDPTIVFRGAGVNTDITLRVPSTGGLSVEGTTGQLFSITDSMSGTIFSVNDVSGIPSIEVLDTGLIKIAQYSGNVVLGSAIDTGTAKFQVTGGGSFTGDVNHSTTGRDVYGPNPSWSSYLYVGGDGVNGITRTASIASVVTTNGNLHLDSGSTATMYLNYYSGTGGITIGNGASGTNANISAGGVFTGTNFSGPGTGLTGTAANLSIGGSAGSVAWSGVTTPPTTLSGYGITDWKYGNYGSIDLISGNSGCYYFTSTAGAVIPGQSDGTVWYHAYPAAPTTWGSQLVQDYRTGRSYLRGRNNGAWSAWLTGLDSGNYNSYSPTLTGTGASGSWAISVTGSSASCTGNSASASVVSMSAARTDSTAYPVVWATTGATSPMYSCTAVNIQSSTGTLNATTIYATGNVTAYSDERVKTNWRGFDYDFISQLAQVKSGVYDRTDCTLTQVGVSAQSLRSVLPEAVLEDEEGKLSVVYGHTALAAVIELAKEIVKLNSIIDSQEARLARLESIINTPMV